MLACGAARPTASRPPLSASALVPPLPQAWLAALPPATPFLASLWLHTVHTPHAALPDFYYLYNDSRGQPAGNYLGLLTQMDAQASPIGRWGL